MTGRANYRHFSDVRGLGTELVGNPDLANDPDIAAQLLAAFLKGKESRICSALAANDLAAEQKPVEGGTHGLADCADAFHCGQGLIPDPMQVQTGWIG